MSTRRTYILLSEACADARPVTDDPKQLRPDIQRAGWQRTVIAIADALARQSTAFDRERFLKDAGVTQ